MDFSSLVFVEYILYCTSGGVHMFMFKCDCCATTVRHLLHSDDLSSNATYTADTKVQGGSEEMFAFPDIF